MSYKQETLEWIESTLIPKLIKEKKLTIDGVDADEVKVKSASVSYLTVTGFALTTPITASVVLMSGDLEKEFKLVIKVTLVNLFVNFNQLPIITPT